MKTNNSFVIAAIFVSIVASNAFAVLRSPFPAKPSAPDRVIVIGEQRHEGVRMTLRPSK
jgi:hypothetical protein